MFTTTMLATAVKFKESIVVEYYGKNKKNNMARIGIHSSSTFGSDDDDHDHDDDDCSCTSWSDCSSVTMDSCLLDSEYLLGDDDTATSCDKKNGFVHKNRMHIRLECSRSELSERIHRRIPIMRKDNSHRRTISILAPRQPVRKDSINRINNRTDSFKDVSKLSHQENTLLSSEATVPKLWITDAV